MICRFCGRRIERSPGRDDDHIEAVSKLPEYFFPNPSAKAHRDTRDLHSSLACPTEAGIIRWHEPVLDSVAEILSALKVIEADLR
jgi:hypothetical protein